MSTQHAYVVSCNSKKLTPVQFAGSALPHAEQSQLTPAWSRQSTRQSQLTAGAALHRALRSSSPHCSHHSQRAHVHASAHVCFLRTAMQTEPQASDSIKTDPQAASPKQLTPQHHRSAGTSAPAALDSKAERQADLGPQVGHKVVLYKGAYMHPFRMLVRFKIFQLFGIAALAVPINTFLVAVSRPLHVTIVAPFHMLNTSPFDSNCVTPCCVHTTQHVHLCDDS